MPSLQQQLQGADVTETGMCEENRSTASLEEVWRECFMREREGTNSVDKAIGWARASEDSKWLLLRRTW